MREEEEVPSILREIHQLCVQGDWGKVIELAKERKEAIVSLPPELGLPITRYISLALMARTIADYNRTRAFYQPKVEEIKWGDEDSKLMVGDLQGYTQEGIEEMNRRIWVRKRVIEEGGETESLPPLPVMEARFHLAMKRLESAYEQNDLASAWERERWRLSVTIGDLLDRDGDYPQIVRDCLFLPPRTGQDTPQSIIALFLRRMYAQRIEKIMDWYKREGIKSQEGDSYVSEKIFSFFLE